MSTEWSSSLPPRPRPTCLRQTHIADFPAATALAKETSTPVGGKDFKTGQTLMKTIIAPGLKARLLGLRGWYSTNILGNRDGEVLDEPEAFKSKEKSKLGVLDSILEPEAHPELYGNFVHKVRIDYYPPRGDSKEGWDNIDLEAEEHAPVDGRRGPHSPPGERVLRLNRGLAWMHRSTAQLLSSS